MLSGIVWVWRYVFAPSRVSGSRARRLQSLGFYLESFLTSTLALLHGVIDKLTAQHRLAYAMALVDPRYYPTTWDEFPTEDRMFHDPIYSAVSSIKAVGSFAAFGSISYGERVNATCSLTVEGVGPIELPPTVSDVAALVQSSQLAPYGHGNQTLVDTNVRNTWEIDASRVSFSTGWYAFLREAVQKAQVEMGFGPGVG